MFWIILLIIFTLFIIYNVIKGNKEKIAREANQATIARIQSRYDSLLGELDSLYDLKICPKCGECEMDLQKISPTGQSIEYQCKYCKKKITAKLLFGSDGQWMVSKQDLMKQLLSTIDFTVKGCLLEEIDTSFKIQIPVSQKVKIDRPLIPESVRNEVWRRDLGKCVMCGSQEKLEFDHIIPISKGGSNTARNLQLLCESCNRKKSNII